MMLFTIAYVVIEFSLIHLEAKPLPNILFILIDDLGWNDLSYHKGSDYQTPNIDELAQNSLKLNNYYVNHICTPTRSSLMSGLYPIHTGLQHNTIEPDAPYGLPLGLTILPQDLKKAGYQTAMIGKWHLGFFAPEYVPTSRGFDSYFGFYTWGESYFHHNISWDGVTGWDLRNNTEAILKPNLYSTYLYGNETIRLLQQYSTSSQENPLFIYLSYQAVHNPLDAPLYLINSFNSTISNEKRRKKAAMTTALDYSIGEIVYFLRNETNLWDNFMIVFSTDNGGPIKWQSSNFPLRGAKATLWEGGTRGIGFVTGGWLNETRRRQKMNALMHITDFYPTICEIVGIEPSNNSILDGYSQLNNLQIGETNIYSPRSEILHNIDPTNCDLDICGGIRMFQYKLVVGWEVSSSNLNVSGWNPLTDVNENYTTIQCLSNENGNYDYPVVDVQYKKTHCPYNGEACLYDVVSDPCEYYDIKNNYTSIYDQLYARLLEYNLTMVPSLYSLFPGNATAANPANLNHFWGPWVNDNILTIVREDILN